MKSEEYQSIDYNEVRKKVQVYWTMKVIYLVGIIADLLMFISILIHMGEMEHVYYYTPVFIWLFERFILLAGFFAVLIIFALIYTNAADKICRIVNEGCDPFLFEVCWRKIKGNLLKRDAYLYNLMTAQYYQGDMDEAWNTMIQIRAGKIKGELKLNYYTIKSDLYFKRGMGSQVKDLEAEFRQRIANPADQKNMEALCVSNNLTRAWLNKDYEAAYRFLEEREYLRRRKTAATLIKVCDTYWNAKLAYACGHPEEAKVRAEETVKYGNRTFMAADARKMLSEIEDRKKRGEEQEADHESR